jgi:hypothetical protein
MRYHLLKPTLSDVFFSTEQFPVWVGNLIFVLNTSIGFFNSLAYSGSALRYISVKKSLVDLQSIGTVALNSR